MEPSIEYHLVSLLRTGATGMLTLEEGATREDALQKFRSYADSVGKTIDKLTLLSSSGLGTPTVTICALAVSPVGNGELPFRLTMEDKAEADVRDIREALGLIA